MGWEMAWEGGGIFVGCVACVPLQSVRKEYSSSLVCKENTSGNQN